MIRIVNKHMHEATPDCIDVYIGRGSPLGNQWTHLPGRMHLAKYRSASRQEAIEKYAEWLQQELTDETSYASKAIARIAGLARKYDVNLVCYCAPQACHGEVIKRVIEDMNKI
jgi:hypothetical protein